MIVLDTNVVAELMKPVSTRAVPVFEFVRARPLESVYTTTITLAETLTGIELLPAGKRKQAMRDTAAEVMSVVFSDRILPFDAEAASTYAKLAVARRSRGLTTPPFDLQIAAIAKSRGMAIVTRNVADFAGAGVEIIDPWTAPISP